MRAVVYRNFGSPDVLHLTEVEKPQPKSNEVLIRVHASSANTGDCARRTLGLFKLKSTISGSELAGEIESAGTDVKLFSKGDQIFAYSGTGANAEYILLPENEALALKPTNMSYEGAATVPHGALAALYFLKNKGGIENGQSILINGSSGGVGTFAIQLANHFGADVTGVCSTANLDMVKSLGANKVVDYTTEDFTQNGQTYDIIFDAVGKSSFSQCKGSLKEHGVYVTTAFGLQGIINMLWTSIAGGKKAVMGVSDSKAEDLIFLKELIEAEKLKSVIDKRYPMEQTAEAHRYVEEGHKKGNVVITL